MLDFNYQKEMDIWAFVAILRLSRDIIRIIVMNQDGSVAYDWPEEEQSGQER